MQSSKPNTGEVVEKETTPLIAECRKDLEKQQSTGSQSSLRSYLWQLAVVFIFVALGSIQALSTKLSEARNGKLPYDSSAAVAIAEAVKLMVSLVCVFFLERDQLSGITASTLRYEFGELSVIAFLFALQNELNFLVIEQLGSALFVMLGNLKIVFTCIFMRLIMGKQFAPLQWFAVCTLFVSAAIVKLPLVVFGAAEHNGTAKKSFLFGIMMLLVACTSSGLSSVQNEIVLKRRGSGGQSLSFMAKNAVLYSWGVFFNALSWMLFGHKPFFACVTQMGLASILCLAGMGLACAVILGYLDNVVRCFSSVAQVLVVVLFSRLLPQAFQEGEIDFFFMAALTLLVVAVVTYQNHDSPNLWTYVYTAAVGSIAMGYMAMTLDSAPHFTFLRTSMH